MVPSGRTRLSAASNRHRRKGYEYELKSRRGICAPRRLYRDLTFYCFLLSDSERIQRRLIDRCCRGQPVVRLVGCKRLAGQWPEQSIHFAPVIAHLLQHGLYVRDHLIRRPSTMTHIDRPVVSIILSRRIVAPCRVPIAVVEEVITASD